MQVVSAHLNMMDAAEKTPASDDIFESVLFAEKNLQEQGKREGAAHGGRIGFLEGYCAGCQKGNSAGSEIGFMLGVCEAVLALREKFAVKGRTLKSVQSLLDSLKKFHFNDPTEENYVEDFEQLRTKFRQVCALLKLSPHHDTQTMSF